MAGLTTKTTPKTIDDFLSFRATSKLVKKGRKNEWRQFLAKIRDGKKEYSFGVIEAAVKLMEELSSGKHPEDALNTTFHAMEHLGLSGYAAGCMAHTVSYYHARGEELREYWDLKYGRVEPI